MIAPSTMKAVRIEHYGGPDVLTLCEVDVPDPGEGEVLVRLGYAGVNVMDVWTRNGWYQRSRTYPIELPTTLGMEAAGVVERLGTGVTDFAVGDRVAYCLVWNAYAEFAVVPAWRLVPVPDEIPLRIAAAMTFQGMTAHYLANDVGRLSSGRTCFIHAAAGGVGQMLVGFASQLGATVYGSVRQDAQKSTVIDRGARGVFLSAEGAFVEPVLAATAGEGVDVVFDSVGLSTLRHDFLIARRRGLVVCYGSSSGNIEDLNPLELGEAGSLYLTRPRLADHMMDGDTIRRRAADIYAAVSTGAASLPLAETYDLTQIAAAHVALESRVSTGKSVVRIFPTSAGLD